MHLLDGEAGGADVGEGTAQEMLRADGDGDDLQEPLHES